jgi:hypothetical protein
VHVISFHVMGVLLSTYYDKEWISVECNAVQYTWIPWTTALVSSIDMDNAGRLEAARMFKLARHLIR